MHVYIIYVDCFFPRLFSSTLLTNTILPVIIRVKYICIYTIVYVCHVNYTELNEYKDLCKPSCMFERTVFFEFVYVKTAFSQFKLYFLYLNNIAFMW